MAIRSFRWRPWSSVVAVLLLAPAVSRAAPIEIAWDKDLAFDYDRENYERNLREMIEQSYAMASAETGFSVKRTLRVNVLTPARYAQQFGNDAWSRQGARYANGAIYVNGGSRFTDLFAGLMVHEMTHAVLDHRGTIRRLPLWLNEGLAERLAWRRKGLDELAPNQRETLKDGARQHLLTPLPAWGTMTFSYLQCYAAVLFFEGRFGKETLLAVVSRTLDGEAFERALDEETRWTITDLNREFQSWAEHL